MPAFIDGEYEDGEIRGCMFIAGKRGTGKTTETARMLSTCGGGTLFFDPLAKHQSILPGYRVFSQPGEISDYLRVQAGRRFRVLYQPRSGKINEHFQAACLIARAFGSLVFAIDELDMMCGAQWGDTRMCPELYALVNYGRHNKVAMLATARYPQSVPRGFTSQCGEMRLFAMTEPKHLRYFEEYIGAETAERVSRLEKYQYLQWRDGAEEIPLCGGRR
jgi:hypothetical protein